jgi:hypothetical protein
MNPVYEACITSISDYEILNYMGRFSENDRRINYKIDKRLFLWSFIRSKRITLGGKDGEKKDLSSR